MIELDLAAVAAATGGAVTGDVTTRVTAVVTDSRDAVPGALFAALRGEQADGHDFAADAAARSAAAALAERPLDLPVPVVVVDDTGRALARLGGAVRRRVDPTVIAVTGSVGKTTTKDLAAAAVGAGRRTVAAPGSFNNELGVPLTLLAVDASTEALVVEVGARRPGDIAALASLVAPDIAVVTAVAGVHLEVFGDIDAVARTKAELVAGLSPDGVAVLNGDDARVAAMAGVAPGAVLRYGLASVNDVAATGVTLDRRARPSFQARTPWGTAAVTLPVAGRHQVGNALAALAAAGSAGVDVGAAAAALAGATVSPWRGQVCEAAGVVVLSDAYNANPTSVLAALDALGAVERPGNSVAVLGVMAEIGAGHGDEHRRVGAHVAATGVDRLIVVGDAARPLIDGALAAGMVPAAADHVPDAAAAADLLCAEIRPGDVVLVKGSRVAGLETVADRLLTALGRGGEPE